MPDIRPLIGPQVRELKFDHRSLAWELVRIEPGEFVMGSLPGEPGREDGEVPARRAAITRPFYLGKYQITQAHWEAVMGVNPSPRQGRDLAVDQIKYAEALEFCERLAAALAVPVTLPTEAQWEYACRAGTTSRYYDGDSEADLDRIAWYRRNSANQVHEVGQKQPNAWGLFDMLGNLYEPCIDFITSFDGLALRDPEGSRFTTHGAMRGGAWMEPAERCRVAARQRTSDMFGPMGIRIAIRV
jgi:formylglycine-generating enzyme required for sulfatase activity